MTNNKYQNKLIDVKNDKIKKSLIELTKVFKKNEKKFFYYYFFFFKVQILITNINAEIKRIISGNKDAKITIIAFESLTCSHCANFHKNVYPQLKKDYIDTGLLKIEFRHFPLDVAAFNASKILNVKMIKV